MCLLLAAVLHVRSLCPRSSRRSFVSVVAFHTQNLLQSLNSVQTSSPVPQSSLGNASMMRCRGPAAAAKAVLCPGSTMQDRLPALLAHHCLPHFISLAQRSIPAPVRRFQTRLPAMAPRSRQRSTRCNPPAAVTIADLPSSVLVHCLGFLTLEQRCAHCNALGRCLTSLFCPWMRLHRLRGLPTPPSRRPPRCPPPPPALQAGGRTGLQARCGSGLRP